MKPLTKLEASIGLNEGKEPDEMAKCVECPSSILEDQGGFGPYEFEPWLSRTNNLKIDTCRFLARFSALLG